jgi:hypothetical protein
MKFNFTLIPILSLSVLVNAFSFSFSFKKTSQLDIDKSGSLNAILKAMKFEGSDDGCKDILSNFEITTNGNQIQLNQKKKGKEIFFQIKTIDKNNISRNVNYYYSSSNRSLTINDSQLITQSLEDWSRGYDLYCNFGIIGKQL